MTEIATKECLILTHKILKCASDLVRAVSLDDNSYVFSDIRDIQDNCINLYEEYLNGHNSPDNSKERQEDSVVCSCYHTESGIPRCWGTKESDECLCRGSKKCCDFYKYDESGNYIGLK